MALELRDLLLCEFSKDGNGPHFYNCWNFSREVFRRAKRQLPLYSEWIESICDRNNFIENLKNCGDFIELNKPEFLAIITLRLSQRRFKCITHMGVVVNKRQFIQIRKAPVNVAIERLDDKRWIKRFEGFYRYVGDNKTQ